MSDRRRYTDEFRAGIVLQLEAAGYPDKKGALSRVAKANKVHARTISRWFWAECNPPPDETVNEKRFDFIEALDAEIESIFGAMPSARRDALYRELGTVLGILVDKKQLLTGRATSRSEHLTVTDEERREYVATLTQAVEAINARAVPSSNGHN